MPASIIIPINKTCQILGIKQALDGVVLSPQNPNYTVPGTVIADPTVIRISVTGEIDPLKLGTTTITATATSPDPNDVSPLQEVLTVTVIGPRANGLVFQLGPVQ
jgi:hypothetical protein